MPYGRISRPGSKQPSLTGRRFTFRSLNPGAGPPAWNRRGAFRLSLCIFLLQTLALGLQAHFVPDFNEILRLSLLLTSKTLMFGASVWVGYIALEPHVRRWWPHTIISWTRLPAGHFGDPRIGRDLLVGGIGGITVVLLNELLFLIPTRLGIVSDPAIEGSINVVSGLRSFVSWLSLLTPSAVFAAMYFPLVFFFLRLVLKKQWLVAVLMIAAQTLLSTDGAVNPLLGGLLGLIVRPLCAA